MYSKYEYLERIFADAILGDDLNNEGHPLLIQTSMKVLVSIGLRIM